MKMTDSTAERLERDYPGGGSEVACTVDLTSSQWKEYKDVTEGVLEPMTDHSAEREECLTGDCLQYAELHERIAELESENKMLLSASADVAVVRQSRIEALDEEVVTLKECINSGLNAIEEDAGSLDLAPIERGIGIFRDALDDPTPHAQEAR